MLTKYGHEYNGQRTEVRQKNSARMTEKYHSLNPSAFALINDENWLREEYVNKRRCSVDIADEVGVDYDTILTRCRRFGFDIRQRVNRSYLEIQIEEYIKSLGFETTSSDRTILSGNREIDIFVPAVNLAIEFNGLYWHSCAAHELEPETRKRHLDKTEECLSKGVSLIHIFEWEWKEKGDIVKSIISSRLGKVDKIYARQCDFVEISVDKEKEFMENNHIQGYKKSDSRIALAYEGEVVFVMSFCKSRFTEKYDTEILRMCGKKNTSVLGAAGKIISKFEETFSGKLLSYANRRFGEGNVYKNCGFERKEDSPIGYWWVRSNRKISRHTVNTEAARQAFLKEEFLPGETENQAMYRCGFRKIFDCGNAVWVKEIK